MAAGTPEPLTGLLSTSFNSSLDSTTRDQSIDFDPELHLTLSELLTLSVTSTISRPIDPYQSFLIPLSTFGGSFKTGNVGPVKTSVSLTSLLLNIDKWSTEGHLIRIRPGLHGSIELLTGLVLSTRLAPFIQINKFTQATSGATRPKFGFTERLQLSYTLSKFEFTGQINLIQSSNGIWKNDYSTLEQVSYALTDTFSVGASHSLAAGFVDESTGFYRSLQVFNNRISRISGFVDFSF